MNQEVAESYFWRSDKRVRPVASLISGILARIGVGAFHQP